MQARSWHVQCKNPDMMRAHRTWHNVAQLLLLGTSWACSGATAEQLPPAPEDVTQATRDTRGAEDAQQEQDAPEVPDEPTLEPQGTRLRVLNASAEVRSRYVPCGIDLSYTIAVRPASLTSAPLQNTCTRVDCSTVPAGETVPPSLECTAPACAPGRIDVAPGTRDEEYDWDGVYMALTQRNCFRPTTFDAGTPMLATVCYGAASGDYEVQDFRCTEHPFAYGQASLEIELR
jgi:hypothetical protein